MRTLTRFAAAPMLAALAAASLQGSGAPAQPKPNDPPRVIELREPDSPFVAFNIWVRSGSAADPKGKEGLASFTAAMMTGGATQQDRVQGIIEKLYPLAAGYGAQVDKEMSVFTGRVHRDNLEAFYTLFRNALLSPAFAEDDFNRLKAQRLNTLERGRRYARDEELSKQLLYWMAYEGTPYQHPEEGYVSSLKAITLDDVKAFYRAHYVRNNVVVGVGGGYPAGFAERVRKDVDALPEGRVQPVAAPAPKQPAGVKVLLVEKQTDASAISFGYPIALLRSHPDFVPMLVANSFFGEHRNSVGRLYQAIRETRGMNYGNYSYIEAFPAGWATQQPRVNVARRSHLFEIWIRPVSLTAPGNLHDRTLFATRAAWFELQKLVQNGMTPEQVEGSKQFLRNYVGTWGNTISRRLAYAIDDAFYGIPKPGFLQSLRGALDKVTTEQVNAALKKHLQDDNMYLVVITADAEAFKKKLLSGEPTTITYAGERSMELMAEDKIISSFPLKVKEGDVTIIPIDKVFE
ncbi:MAG TPA: pitrilysin family protein [Vicinamibacterales bacterium]|nr:pitrilysin family protein [Vicinamibacterales bacterium]